MKELDDERINSKYLKEENKDKVEDFPKALMKKLKEKKNIFSKRTLGRHILNREIHSINLKDIIEIKEKRSIVTCITWW